MGTGSFPGVKCGRGMLLSWKSRAIPLPTFWATPGLERKNFTFTFCNALFTFLIHTASWLPVYVAETCSCHYNCYHKFVHQMSHISFITKPKGKAIPSQAWLGPEGSRRLRLPDFKIIGTWRWKSCQPYAPAAFTLQEIFLVRIPNRGWIDPRATVQPERLCQSNPQPSSL